MSDKQEIVIDSFAGGGGASLGITWAMGKSPDIAINHDAEALRMHAANHPSTKHVCEDVWKANLKQLVGRQHVGLLWASPDCKHFSRAKGSKPVSKNIRSLAWVVCKWAAEVRPRVIMLENVREFADWGPLLPAWRCSKCGWRGTEGQAVLVRTRRRCPRCESAALKITVELMPDPDRKGLTFRRWLGRLRNLGYAIQWKNLDAADFGAPTHRRRLFLIARRDGEPIVWPEHSHGDPQKLDAEPLFNRLKPWRTAAECIDWAIPCQSIFDRPRPLAEKTMRRIAMGLRRYVLENQRPFIVCCNHSGEEFRGQDLNEPFPTLTASRDAHGLVSPYLTRICQNGSNGKCCNGPSEPLTTVVSKAEHCLVAPTLLQYNGQKADEVRGKSIDEPINVVPTENRHAVVAAWLVKHFGGMVGVPVGTPLPTTTSRGTQNQLACAYLARFNHGEKQWAGVGEPLGTVTSQGNKFGLVYAFLTKYFSTAVGQDLFQPLHTVTGKHRFGLVLVEVAPGQAEPAVAVDVQGVGQMIIADIGMRMLTPRELARAQGFPDTYELIGTKSSQVAKIGNSVCPDVPAALVRVNCPELCGVATFATQ